MARRIDDHSFWAGKGGSDSPLPKETKVKTYDRANSAGSLSPYEDTEEAIRKQQNMNVAKAKAHPQKPYHKN